MPGWRFDGNGFRADAPGAEWLRFPETVPPRVLETIDDRRVVFRTGGRVWMPQKLRFDLTDVGPLMRCPKGLDLRLSSTAAPYLSWTEGSVGPNVPTPLVKWLLLSFQDGQPPIVIGFSGEPAAFSLRGSPGAWSLRSAEKTDLGWVRLALPYGNRPFATNSAATLGQATLVAAENAALWSQPPVEMTDFAVEGDPNGVTATWTFDRPNVVVPTAFDLAPPGGYILKILSPARRLAMPLGETGERTETSTVITEGNTLTVRFPTRELPLGRALAIGPPGPLTAPPTFGDVGAVARFSLDLLLAGRTPGPTDLDPLYYESAPSATEPLTGQRLLFEPNGKGLDLAAAQALFTRCRASAEATAMPPEPQLVSLIWRRDWRTMTFFGVDEAQGRRAGALAALAGAFSPDPSRRLEGALFETGLAAARARAGLRALDANAPSPRLSEPFDRLRNAVFNRLGPKDPFWDVLASPVRIVSEPSFRTDDGATLAWTARTPFRLGISVDLAQATPLVREDAIYRFPESGTATMVNPPKLPALLPVPAWDETSR